VTEKDIELKGEEEGGGKKKKKGPARMVFTRPHGLDSPDFLRMTKKRERKERGKRESITDFVPPPPPPSLISTAPPRKEGKGGGEKEEERRRLGRIGEAFLWFPPFPRAQSPPPFEVWPHGRKEKKKGGKGKKNRGRRKKKSRFIVLFPILLRRHRGKKKEGGKERTILPREGPTYATSWDPPPFN